MGSSTRSYTVYRYLQYYSVRYTAIRTYHTSILVPAVPCTPPLLYRTNKGKPLVGACGRSEWKVLALNIYNVPEGPEDNHVIPISYAEVQSPSTPHLCTYLLHHVYVSL